MAGGTFDIYTPKVRPGVYSNIESAQGTGLDARERGIAFIPLIDFPYGPEKEFIAIEAAAPDANITKLGYSVYDPILLPVHEALKNAAKVLVYIPAQGAKAKAVATPLTATARFGGRRGNELKVAIVANPAGGFDVSVFLSDTLQSLYKGLATVEDLIAQNNEWIDFSGTGNLVAAAALNLSGGTNGTALNEDVMNMLDAAEGVKWYTMAFPLEPTGEPGDPIPALQAAVASKVIEMREAAGKLVQCAFAKYSGNHEALINVTNGVILENGAVVNSAQATGWVAGATAGATARQSLTYRAYGGAVGVYEPKTNADSIEAIKNGEFFFSMAEMGSVIAEYDINSLKTFDEHKDARFAKNKVLRVFDTVKERILGVFVPGQYPNTPTQWDALEGMGLAILLDMQGENMIIDVDTAADFKVDRSLSRGDSLFVNVGIKPVDTADKIYFPIRVR